MTSIKKGIYLTACSYNFKPTTRDVQGIEFIGYSNCNYKGHNGE